MALLAGEAGRAFPCPQMPVDKINRVSRCYWVGSRFDLVRFDRSSRRLDHLRLLGYLIMHGIIIS